MERMPRFSLPEDVKASVRATAEQLSRLGDATFIVPELSAPSTHLLDRPGKLLRPALVFLGAIYSGAEKLDSFVDLAAAIELLHISSMICDDMIDSDARRRGVESVHAKYGREKAILASNALIAQSIEKSSGYGPEVIRTTSNAAMQMCAGEMLDHKYQQLRKAPPLDECLRIAELKSASLISAASCTPAQHIGSQRAKELSEFGRLFGIAFQIRDDVIDFAESAGDSGDFSPNVVRSIALKEKDPEKVVREAARLNNEYIDEALSHLKAKDKSKLLSGYAELIRLDPKSLK